MRFLSINMYTHVIYSTVSTIESQEFFSQGPTKYDKILKLKNIKKYIILQINFNSLSAIFQGIIYYKFGKTITKFITFVTA